MRPSRQQCIIRLIVRNGFKTKRIFFVNYNPSFVTVKRNKYKVCIQIMNYHLWIWVACLRESTNWWFTLTWIFASLLLSLKTKQNNNNKTIQICWKNKEKHWDRMLNISPNYFTSKILFQMGYSKDILGNIFLNCAISTIRYRQYFEMISKKFVTC